MEDCVCGHSQGQHYPNTRGCSTVSCNCKALTLPETERSLTHYQKLFVEIHEQQKVIFLRKNADYGDSFAKSVGGVDAIKCVWVRAMDKVKRIENILASGKEPQNESLKDSWSDLAVYCELILVLLKEKEDL